MHGLSDACKFMATPSMNPACPPVLRACAPTLTPEHDAPPSLSHHQPIPPDCTAGLAATNPGLAKLAFALTFPCGLFMLTMHCGELFTGSTYKMVAAVVEGKVGSCALIGA